MELYSKDENYTLYSGNMLDMLEVIEPNSIDVIVTDPPYELNFMNKGWDNTGIAFQKETWRKCYDVLKSGGHMLVFGGSRTFHRIACAIEDAGFEIRDTIMYLYGCLSEDTEILTSNGWKNLETIKNNDDIYSLDFNKNNIIKNKCLNVFRYEYTGEMVNLKNQNTDQLLTPNHHCIMKDTIRTRIKGKVNYNSYNYWYYKDAWQIRSQSVKLPLASNYDGTLEIGNLFAELLGWVISEGTYLKDTNAITISQSNVNYKYVQRIRYILGKLKIKYTEYSRERIYKDRTYIEYEFYIGKDSWDIVNKIKTLAPKKKLTWNLLELSLSNKEFLIKGLLQGDGSKDTNTIGFSAFNQKDLEQLEIFQVLLHMTNKQGWINKNKHCCSIHNNPITELQGKHHKNRFVQYNGKYVWCIETEVGNFIARRNGKVFITGNSGFPKSMNIGLAIDKRNGVESKVIGVGKSGSADTHTRCMNSKTQNGKDVFGGEYEIKQAQNEWNGWGTQLKPSYEPIIVCRKPCEGSIVDNVMKYGVGGINIDECRVPTEDNVCNHSRSSESAISKGIYGDSIEQETHQTNGRELGRFPANTILTYDDSDFDEVCGGFPNSGNGNGKGAYSYSGVEYHNKDTSMFNGDKSQAPSNYNDNGSASRYFYCAKASKRDRDEGLPNKWLDSLEIILQNGNEELLWKDTITIKEVDKVKHLMDMDTSLQKVIEESGILMKKDTDLSMLSFGKNILEKCLKENKYITKIGINSTTKFQILNLLTLYNTKENILNANYEMVYGGNPVDIVVNTNQLQIIIKEKAELAHSVNSVVLKMLWKINEKDGRNEHCTVKPTSLMQYLVRLVTPKGGTVLDPFNGSGSTGKACMYENADRNANYKYIGIELTEEYLPISKARIEFAEKNPIMDFEANENKIDSATKEDKNRLF